MLQEQDFLINKKELRVDYYISLESMLINSDKKKVQQLVYNLLSNAIKFSPQGGILCFELSGAYIEQGSEKTRALFF